MCNFKSRLFFQKEQYSNKTCEQNTALPRFCFLQAIARCCICNFEPHKRMRLMWHLLKMQSNASPSEESCITWMHRDNPPCKMQYMDYASQELHITRCKGPALLRNMQCIQDASQEAWITRCMWLVPLARRIRTSRSAELWRGWVLGSGWGRRRMGRLWSTIYFFFFRSEFLLSFNFAPPNTPKMLT